MVSHSVAAHQAVCCTPSYLRRCSAVPEAPVLTELLWPQPLLEEFDSLSVGPTAPGQPPGITSAALPRPVGENAAAALEAPPLAHPRNCEARFMRVTVSAIPSQQVRSPDPPSHLPTAAWDL